MTRPVCLSAVLLMVLCGFACAVSTARGQADAESQRYQTRAVLGPVDVCALPCWQGIRPGHTASGDAIDRLRQSAGVTNITSMQGIAMNESVVNWTWNGQQSPVIDGGRGARMWFHNGVVSVIELPLTVSVASVWDALGKPESVRVARSPRVPPAVFYQASYFGGGLQLRTTVTCPLGAWNTLAATVDAQLQDPAELSGRNPLLVEPLGCP